MRDIALALSEIAHPGLDASRRAFTPSRSRLRHACRQQARLPDELLLEWRGDGAPEGSVRLFIRWMAGKSSRWPSSFYPRTRSAPSLLHGALPGSGARLRPRHRP